MTEDKTDESVDRNTLLRRAYTKATQQLREAHSEEFINFQKEAAKELGLDYKPRLSKEDKAIAEVDSILTEHPELAKAVAERAAEVAAAQVEARDQE